MNKMKLCPDLGFQKSQSFMSQWLDQFYFTQDGVWGFENAPQNNAIQSCSSGTLLQPVSETANKKCTWVK